MACEMVGRWNARSFRGSEKSERTERMDRLGEADFVEQYLGRELGPCSAGAARIDCSSPLRARCHRWQRER